MSEARTALLMGGGGHAAVVADAMRAMGLRLIGLLDDNVSASLPGIERIGSIDSLREHVSRADVIHAATGRAELRRDWLTMALELGACVDPIVHPSAVVSSSAAIGPGAFIGPLAIVNARAAIGRGAIVNSGAIVEHDVTVGDWSHVAPRAVLAGCASAGEAALIGCGAVALPGIRIGDGATLGAGAAAVRDVADGETAAGVPAVETSKRQDVATSTLA